MSDEGTAKGQKVSAPEPSQKEDTVKVEDRAKLMEH